MIRFCLACVLSLLLLCPQSARAQDDAVETAAIGRIAEVEGNVGIDHNGAQALAQVGEDIYIKDIIETGPDSRVLLLFIDDTELTLGENARTTVDEYVFDTDDPASNKGRFSVLRGPFRFVTGLIDKVDNPDVQIETPYGSIGIRGTTVWGGTMDDDYNVMVEDGAVTFENKRGKVRIDAGQASRIHGLDAIPGRAAKWEEARLQRAHSAVALKHAAEARQRVAQMKEQHADMRARFRKVLHERGRQQQEQRQQRMENHPDDQRKRSEKLKEDPVRARAVERAQHRRAIRRRR